jgi:hypothetical protein
METDNKVKLILGLVFGVAMLIVAVIIGFLLVQNVAEIEVSDHAGTQTETYSPSTSLTNTLSPSGEGITSFTAQTYNQTWLDFDGVDDKRIEIPHSSSYSNNFTEMSWCWWGIHNNISSPIYQNIFTKYDVNNNQRGFQIRKEALNISIFITANGVDFSSIVCENCIANDNDFHFYCITYNNTNVLFYKDSIFLSTSTFVRRQVFDAPLTPLYIGSYSDYNRVVNGSLDKLTIYDFDLTQEGIEYIYNLER